MRTKVRKSQDGRMMRLVRCECDTPLFEKDLTNDGRYDILMRHNREHNILAIKAGDHIAVTCPKCSVVMNIYDVREVIGISEAYEAAAA